MGGILVKNKLYFFKIYCFIFFSSIYGIGICNNSLDIETLPTPYNQLKNILPYRPHGWYGNSKEIEILFKKHKPKIIVELGSWLGQSTCHMAGLLEGKGKIYAIDHWLGSIVPNRPNQAEYESFLPTLYEQFLSNVIHQGMSHTIIPWKMTTAEAAHRMHSKGISIDLIYIDAAHDEKSVYEDLSNWYPLVKKGGVICGDDWSYNQQNGYSVRRAVYRFIRENHLKLEIARNNFWMFYKP